MNWLHDKNVSVTQQEIHGWHPHFYGSPNHLCNHVFVTSPLLRGILRGVPAAPIVWVLDKHNRVLTSLSCLKISTPSPHTSSRDLLEITAHFLPNVLQWFCIVLRVKPNLLALPCKTRGDLTQLTFLRGPSSLASLSLPFCLLLEHLRGSLLDISSLWNAFCSPSQGCILLFGSLVIYAPQRGCPWPD